MSIFKHARAKKIMNEMLEQRKYKEIDEDDMIKKYKDKDNNYIYLVKEIFPKVNTDVYKTLNIYSTKNNINHLIILSDTQATSSVRKSILNVKELLEIELFLVDDIQTNITKHRLVPIHIGMDRKRSKEILSRWGRNIPKMFIDDPISKFYNFTENQVIQIIRHECITYRLVIPRLI